jgi:TatD DNase family protein
MFDTHAHLDFNDFDRDRDSVLERARSAGIEGILSIGIDLATSLSALAIADANEWIWASAAVHPNSTARTEAVSEFAEIRKMVLDGVFTAVGETGMDLYRERSPRTVQENFFRRHIELALEADRPLIIHCRDAHEEVEAVLGSFDLDKARVVMHCFGAPPEYAGRFADAGCYISFAGNVTYKNAEPLREAARLVPDELLLSETDCPFLAPVPLRGKRNEPALMAHTVDCLAKVRGKSRKEMDALLMENARRFLFGDAR